MSKQWSASFEETMNVSGTICKENPSRTDDANFWMPSRMLCTDHHQANEQRIVPIDMSAKQAQQGLPLRVGA
jgi:hypothetical protein